MKVTTSLIMLFVWNWSLSATNTKQLIHNQVSADLNKVNSPAMQAFKQANRNRGAGGFVSVGPDISCNFNVGATRIQDAIDSGATEIRVTNDDTYIENLSLDDTSVIIRGGYANCAAANNGSQPVGLSTLDGSANLAPAIAVTGNSSRSLIVLENLIITNSTRGGIDAASANAQIDITNSSVSNNSDTGQGGGISIFLGDTDVIGRDVSISHNTAGFGGGLGCQGFQASILILGSSTIQNNAATATSTPFNGVGGGLSLGQGCVFSLYSGELADDTKQQPAQQQKGLIQPHFFLNQANSFGGAISSINDSKVFLFGQRMCVDGQCLGDNETPVFVFQNQSGVTMGGEGGGAIRIRGTDNQAIMNGVYFNNNQSGGHGGGFYVEESAELRIYREPGACWHPIFCNAIFNNVTSTAIGLGGAIYNNGSTTNISSAFISENRADFGTAIYTTEAAATNRFETVIINDNGNNGADGFSDNHVMGAALGASLDVIHSTLVDNNAETSVFGIDVAFDSSLNLQSSIVYDASSGPVLNLAPGSTTINCLMAHEEASVTGTNITVDDPEFIDPNNGDFGLNPTLSPAIDYCDDSQITIEHLDINNEMRGWDDPTVANQGGPFDLGADETYANDIIFEDGFEF